MKTHEVENVPLNVVNWGILSGLDVSNNCEKFIDSFFILFHYDVFFHFQSKTLRYNTLNVFSYVIARVILFYQRNLYEKLN